jgi:hypothetical protein
MFASGRRSRAIIGQPAIEGVRKTWGRASTNLASSDPHFENPRPVIFAPWPPSSAVRMGISSLCFRLGQPGLRQCSQVREQGLFHHYSRKMNAVINKHNPYSLLAFSNSSPIRQFYFLLPINPPKCQPGATGHTDQATSLSPSYKDPIAHSADMISHKRPQHAQRHTPSPFHIGHSTDTINPFFSSLPIPIHSPHNS